MYTHNKIRCREKHIAAVSCNWNQYEERDPLPVNVVDTDLYDLLNRLMATSDTCLIEVSIIVHTHCKMYSTVRKRAIEVIESEKMVIQFSHELEYLYLSIRIEM